MSAESDLRRYRTEANRLRIDISKVSSTVAAKRKKAADATSAASRSKSAMTIKSKLSEGERATKEANDAEKKRADLERKLADVEVKATRAQEKWDRERQTAEARAIQGLRRTTNSATSQFAPSRRFLESSSLGPAFRIEPVRDVFLSHASEDKEEIARPLREALESRGVSVWFDEIQIKVGNSIRQSIEKGIAACRFGVVVVSPHFFAKQWTNAELDALSIRKWSPGRISSYRSGIGFRRMRSCDTLRCSLEFWRSARRR